MVRHTSKILQHLLPVFEILSNHFGMLFIKGLIVGNKAKGRISKRVFQENKARQIFRKTNISYSLILTRASAYQGQEMFVLRKIWRALFS